MKIRKLSCDQFAGLRGAELSFSDGINLLYGKNESGKSTVVSLLSALLFQNAEIGKRDKKDKEFAASFYTVRKDGTKNAAIDGRLAFSTENGDFTLSKEWGDASVKLVTPDDVLKNQDEVNAALEKELGYGKGVYTELLLSPQRGADEALARVLNGDALSTDELTALLTAAFGESGGASVDEIEKALDEKIFDIAKTTWDTERDAPKKKTDGKRHQKGIGTILQAYYDLEDAREALARLTKSEQEAEEAKLKHQELALRLSEKKQERDELRGISELIKNQKNAKALLLSLETDLDELQKALRIWPETEKLIQKASALAEEIKNRSLLDQYEKADGARKRCDELSRELEKMSSPTQAEISEASQAQREIRSLKNSLCGMNLNSVIRMMGGHTVRVTSLRTGEEIPLQGEKVALAEAVRISIPDVMEMELFPADVDVSATRAQLEAYEGVLGGMFQTYGCDSVEEMQQLASAYKDKQSELKSAQTQLGLLLNGSCLEEMKEAIGRISVLPRSLGEIEDEIRALCGGETPDVFAGSKRQIVTIYREKYGNLEELPRKILEKEAAIAEAKKAHVSEDEIPEKYRGITDPESNLRTLDQLVELYEGKEKELISESSGAETLLNSLLAKYGDRDLSEEAAEKERVFLAEKEALAHWLHIKQVFLAEKEKLQGNPMENLAKSFTRYLEILTGGTAKSEIPGRDRLEIALYSKDRPMEYAKLSEGTKETVSLAYRLAVLDELFPRGGGMIVLDDPLTDMDDDRTARSCDLIRECAARHQVIFLTCKEEYKTKLGGKVIEL